MLDAIVFTTDEMILKPQVTPEMRPDDFEMYVAGQEEKSRRIMIYGVPKGSEGHFHLQDVADHSGYRSFKDPEVMQQLFDVMGWDKKRVYVGSPIPCIIDFGENRYVARDALSISADNLHIIADELIYDVPQSINQKEMEASK